LPESRSSDLIFARNDLSLTLKLSNLAVVPLHGVSGRLDFISRSQSKTWCFAIVADGEKTVQTGHQIGLDDMMGGVDRSYSGHRSIWAWVVLFCIQSDSEHASADGDRRETEREKHNVNRHADPQA
jgi:hypothetical protein